MVGWLKLTSRTSSNNKRNWNMQHYVGKVFMSKTIMAHWYRIVSTNFHEHAMTGMMVLRQVYALVFISSDARKSLPRDGSLRIGDVGELGR